MKKENLCYDKVVHETERAYLLLVGEVEVWLPKSQVTLCREWRTFCVPQWLAHKHGWAPAPLRRKDSEASVPRCNDFTGDTSNAVVSAYDIQPAFLPCGCHDSPMGGCTGDCAERSYP